MIYLLRHGETVWNKERRLQGRLDSPLTAKGIRQAQKLGKLLAKRIQSNEVVRIQCSPLGRAWQTAVLVADELGHSISAIERSPQLVELAYGDWEGMTSSEIAERYPAELASRERRKWSTRVPGGESYEDVASRVGLWLANLSKSESHVVVCHGITSRIVRGLYAELGVEELLSLGEPQDSLFILNSGQVIELSS